MIRRKSIFLDFLFDFFEQFGNLELLWAFLEAGFAFDAGVCACVFGDAVIQGLETRLVATRLDFKLVVKAEDGRYFDAGGAGHAVAAARAGDGARLAVGLDGCIENFAFIVGERLEFGERLDVFLQMLHF